MLSIVIPRVSVDGTKFIDEPSDIWDDEKEAQFEEMLSGRAVDPMSFYASVEWQEVSERLEIRDIDFLKGKADQLFDREFPLVREPVAWNKRGVVFSDVDQLFARLGFESFGEAKKDNSTEEDIRKEEDENIRLERHANEELKGQIDTKTFGNESGAQTSIGTETETGKEINANVTIYLGSKKVDSEFSTRDGMALRRVSFGTPTISESNVNVTTKSELKKFKSPRNVLADMLKKIKLQFLNKGAAPGPFIMDSKDKRRRASVVQEQLPGYIRNQLKQRSASDAEVHRRELNRDKEDKNMGPSLKEPNPLDLNQKLNQKLKQQGIARGLNQPSNLNSNSNTKQNYLKDQVSKKTLISYQNDTTSPGAISNPKQDTSGIEHLNSPKEPKQTSKTIPREIFEGSSPEPFEEPHGHGSDAFDMNLLGDDNVSQLRAKSKSSRAYKSRLQNLLANSQSLYANKDMDPGASYNNSLDSEVSDVDEAYVLPSLIRYSDSGLAEDDDLDMNEDADFLNLSLTSRDTDEYLFTNV